MGGRKTKTGDSHAPQNQNPHKRRRRRRRAFHNPICNTLDDTMTDQTMTARTFAQIPAKMGISRRELCRRLGIAKSTGDKYADGRSDVPKVVALAIAALQAGLDNAAPGE